MAYTTIKKPSDYFETKLWSGNNTDPTTISGLNFQPDMIWGKARSGTYSTQDHCINDAVRGANKILRVNQANAEETDDNNIKSFTSDGWTMGNDGKINQASTEYVGWSWKANGAGVANTDGSISSTVSANTTSGFSIVGWTGSDANGTIGHGLGSAPRVIIIKNRGSAEQWYVYHESMGNGNKLTLNDTTAQSSAADWWQDTSPTSSFFYVSGVDGINGANEMIAYCFAEKQGFSKFGSYTGNGNADGTFVYTGFKPAFVIVKRTDAGDGWIMFDNKRSSFNIVDKNVQANSSNAETTSGYLDFTSNGFKLRMNGASANGSGASYIYMAFAEQPLVGDNPATAR